MTSVSGKKTSRAAGRPADSGTSEEFLFEQACSIRFLYFPSLLSRSTVRFPSGPSNHASVPSKMLLEAPQSLKISEFSIDDQ